MDGTSLIVADSNDNKLEKVATISLPLTSGEEARFLTQLLDAFENNSEGPALNKAVKILQESEKACIVYGKTFAENANETAITLLLKLAEKINANLIGVKGNANSMTAAQLELEAPFNNEGCLAAFVLLGDEDPSQKLVKTLDEIPFVVAQATYRSQLTGKANVVLPVTMWAEQSGNYLSLDGKIQKAVKALDAPEGVLTSQEALLRIAKNLSIEPNMDWKASLMKRVPTVEIQEV